MKITQVETFQLPEYPLSVWVMVHTDAGLVGLGESTNQPDVIATAIHSFVAPLIIGCDPENIEDIWNRVYAVANFQGCAGAELRALSAVDIALWDLLGKSLGRPVYALLGGKVRDRVKLYNTCGNPSTKDVGYNDTQRFMTDAGGLARDLLSSGISAMKIWPLDALAQAYRGQHISRSDLQKGIEPVKKIREAVGYEMEIAVECHSYWNVPTAIRIAKELEQYDIKWLEDPILVDDVDNLLALREKTTVPILASERLFTRMQYKPLLEKHAVDVVMVDLSWTGGLTEGKKIASMADAYRVPITTHNCGGPVLTKASAHFSISTINAIEMESERAMYQHFHEISDSQFDIRDGYIHLDNQPGLGVSFSKEMFARKDIVRISQ